MKTMTSILSLTALLCASSLTWAEGSDGEQMPPPHDKASMQQHMQKRLKEVDTNGDGNISKAEFMAQSEKRFAKMDTNGDGQISPEERKQAHQNMMQKHKNKGQKPAADTAS